MKLYYILAKEIKTGDIKLVENVGGKNLTAVRVYAARTYVDIITSGTHQLIVVGKAGYEQYYEQHCAEFYGR